MESDRKHRTFNGVARNLEKEISVLRQWKNNHEWPFVSEYEMIPPPKSAKSYFVNATKLCNKISFCFDAKIIFIKIIPIKYLFANFIDS